MIHGVVGIPPEQDTTEKVVQRVLDLEKGSAGGIAGLDSSAHVPTNQLGSGTADSTKVLLGNNTWGAAGGAISAGDYNDIEVVSATDWRVEAWADSVVVRNVTELEAAVAALTAGKTIWIAPGTYTLTQRMRLLYANTTLTGAGDGLTILQYTADRNTDIISIEHNNITIQDLTVRGIATTAVNGSGAAGTGRGIVVNMPTGTGSTCYAPTIRRCSIYNTGSWCIYDAGIANLYISGSNYGRNGAVALASSGFALSIFLTLDEVNVHFWASGGGLYVGSGAAAPQINRLKTNGYTYNTFSQVTGTGATPTQDMGGGFFFNVYGARLHDCYFQSPSDGGTLPDTDAVMLSFLNCHGMAVTKPNFEVLSTTLVDSNNGAGGRQYYFITACNCTSLEIEDSYFQTRAADGGSTLSNWGAKIIRTADNPSYVGISFTRGICWHERTTIVGASGAKDTGDPVPWDRNDFVFAGNLDGDSTSYPITIDDFIVANSTTGKQREASIPYNTTFTVVNCESPAYPLSSTTLNTTTGDFSAGTGASASSVRSVNRGDSVTDGVTTTRVRYVMSTTQIITEDALTVAPGTTITFTPAGMNIGFKPTFRVRQRHGSQRFGSWATCDLAGAGDKDDFRARTQLSQPLYAGIHGYVASSTLDEGLWISNGNDNDLRQVPFYRRRASFWTNPKQGDLNYRTDSEALFTYNATTAAFETYIKRTLGTAAGDLIYYTASDTPTRLAAGTTGHILTQAAGPAAPSWAAPDFKDTLFRVQDDGDASKKLALECSGITASTTRTIKAQDASGSAVIVGNAASASGVLGTIALTGQTGSLGAQTLVTGNVSSAGLYRVSLYLKTTTAGDPGDTVSVTLAWNDGSGQTYTTANLDAATLNAYLQDTVVVRAAASQNVTFTTTLTSPGAGTPAYTIDARVEALG